MSTDRGVDQEEVVYIHNRIRLSHKKKKKKNEILPIVPTWMDFEGIMLSELSQEKDKYHMISFINGI